MESLNLKVKILKLIDKYNTLSSIYNGIRNGKYKNSSSINIRINSINKSINSAKRDIHDYLLGVPIIEATYTIDNITYQCRLTNISVNDLTTLLNEVSRIKGNKIKILEIKEIPTYINKV